MSSDVAGAKRKNRALMTYAILGAIIIALVLYVVLRRQNRVQYDLPVLERVSVGEIEELSIASPNGSTIRMERSGEDWLILPQGYKVDSKLAADMTKAISDFRISDLVSTAAFYGRYDLGEETKLTITAGGDGRDLLVFDAGKRAPSFNHTYVLIPGDDQVYHATGDLRRTFDKSISDLRDKLVLEFDKTQVQTLSLAWPDRDLQLVQSTETTGSGADATERKVWRSPSGDLWEEAPVNELLDRIDDLRCSKFLEDEKADLGQPLLVLTAGGDKEYRFFLFGEVDGGYQARSSETPYPFLISTWLGERILEAFQPDGED